VEDHIELYTDGAASGNPGPGGFGVVLKYKNHRKELCGGYRLTTNNRMELLAVIVGLESITDSAIKVKIYSDSKYIVDAINLGWLAKWKRTNFTGKANMDLWLRFLKIYKPQMHQFFWVKGHSVNVENNRCDTLAVMASKKGALPPDIGYESIKKPGMFKCCLLANNQRPCARSLCNTVISPSYSRYRYTDF
jgi:ribonuclease HI